MSKIWGVILAVLISSITIIPLFQGDYFPIHDDVQITRVFEMTKAIQDGQFPVRWVADLGYGYGYPIFNFYAPLPYYVGTLFDLVGFTPLIATKIMMGIGMMLSGIFMFILARRFWGDWGGLIAASAYQFAPYHAIELYVRGSVGELYAYAFLPLAVYGIVLLFSKRKNIYTGFIALLLGYTGVILSHNITSLLFTMMIAIAGIVWLVGEIGGIKKLWGKGKWIAVSIVLAFGISSFFWLPALFEKDFASVDQITRDGSDYRLHFLYLDQLWDSPWGFAGSAPGRADGMSFKIGKVHLLLGFIGLVGAFWSTRKSRMKRKIIWLAILLLSISIFMTLERSVVIWDAISIFSFVQFPWRFLIFILFIVSLVSGGAVKLFDIKKQFLAVGSISSMVLIVFVNAKYFQPQMFYQINQDTYENESIIKWDKSKISDEYLPVNFPIPKTVNDIETEPFTVSDNVQIVSSDIRSHVKSITIVSKLPNTVLINTAYFPGWIVKVDQMTYQPEIIDGKMAINVSHGTHTITAYFKNTGIRTLANAISVISLIIFFGTIIKLKGPYGKKNKR